MKSITTTISSGGINPETDYNNKTKNGECNPITNFISLEDLEKGKNN